MTVPPSQIFIVDVSKITNAYQNHPTLANAPVWMTVELLLAIGLSMTPTPGQDELMLLYLQKLFEHDNGRVLTDDEEIAYVSLIESLLEKVDEEIYRLTQSLSLDLQGCYFWKWLEGNSSIAIGYFDGIHAIQMGPQEAHRKALRYIAQTTGCDLSASVGALPNIQHVFR